MTVMITLVWQLIKFVKSAQVLVYYNLRILEILLENKQLFESNVLFKIPIDKYIRMIMMKGQ